MSVVREGVAEVMGAGIQRWWRDYDLECDEASNVERRDYHEDRIETFYRNGSRTIQYKDGCYVSMGGDVRCGPLWDGQEAVHMTLFSLAPEPRKMPCSYSKTCTRPGLLLHEMCERHAGYHRMRNNKYKRSLAFRWEQLGWRL